MFCEHEQLLATNLAICERSQEIGGIVKLIDTIAASKRRGINRVVWAMQVKPPRVPRAAQLALNASQGPRVPPGTYSFNVLPGTSAEDRSPFQRRIWYGVTSNRSATSSNVSLGRTRYR